MLLASSALAGLALAAGLAIVAAPAANAVGDRHVTIFYSGSQSVSGQLCENQRQALLTQGADVATCSWEPANYGTLLTATFIRS